MSQRFASVDAEAANNTPTRRSGDSFALLDVEAASNTPIQQNLEALKGLSTSNSVEDLSPSKHADAAAGGGGGISSMGLKVLVLLAFQNSSKNLLMRFVMKEKPKFLTSAAVIGSECIKLTLSILYILLVERKSPTTIVEYFRQDWTNTILVTVPASAYNLQMTLEYIALANLDVAML